MLRTSNRIALQFAAALLAFCAAPLAQAQTALAPSLLNFQGRLARPDGAPVADSGPMQVYNLTLSLWDAASGGTRLWEQTFSDVAVRNGTFAALLNVGANFQNGATAATLFNGNLHLQVQINNDAPLTPRQPVVSVAYAQKANTVPDNAITSAKILDGAITGADIANGTITGDKLASGLLHFWSLSGNAGTSASQFIGTTDSQPLRFRTNNIDRMLLSSAGTLSIGSSIPDTNFALALTAPNAAQGTLVLRNSADLPRWHFVLTPDGASNGLNFVESAVAANRLYLKPGGNIGIGTNNPQRLLHLASAASPEIRLQDTASGRTYHLGVNSTDGTFRVAQSAVQDFLVLQPNQGTVADQSQINAPQTSSNNVAQTFMPSRDGKILQVKVYLGNTDSSSIPVPISILRGNDASGVELVRQTFTVAPGAPGWKTFTFTNSVLVSGGVTYTLFLEGAATQTYGYANNNPYANGNMLYRQNGTVNDDLAFEIMMGRPGVTGVEGTLSVNVPASAADGLRITTPGQNNYAIRIHNQFAPAFTTGMFVTNDGFFQVTNNVNGGAFARLNSAGIWTSTSDRRMKKEIEPLDGLLEKTLALRPVSYLFHNEDAAKTRRHIGFIAQEVETLFPSLVSGAEVKTLDYSGLSVAAVGAIQEMYAKMMQDQKRLSLLETENAELKAQLAELAAAVRELQQKQPTR